MKKKNICVVVTDKAHLSRLLTLLKEIKRSPKFKLQIAVGGGAMTYRYGNIVKELVSLGLKPDVAIPTVIEGGEHLGMAKTAALGMLEFATAFNNLESDYVVLRGDRFEILPIAAAATYQNKVLVHLEGGDVSGSIDESVRHAVTKLAHLHFVTNQEAKQRLIKMGEEKNRVWNAGSLDIDYLTKLKFNKKLDDALVNSHGVGYQIDLAEQYVVVMLNPVTTEASQATEQVEEALSAVHSLGFQAIWIWPNLGAGADAIAKKMREWQAKHVDDHKIRFIRYIPPGDYANLVNQAVAVIGNSSAGIKECGWMGVPAVNIGTRQQGRLRGDNVIDVPYKKEKIIVVTKRQIKVGRYKRSMLYGKGDSAKEIVKVLEKVSVDTQKRITY
jgi:UDP-hydrolysing UDP-N-acetyl-D-glucosamine 2-epimerase